ncbi:hypothetical protein V4R08_14810 [Nitrobacter sp. NHB1]|uniref:hypothetical protein n=1 Tax=Nitrobacter sp. NHB1 TaxID=3119830 RepID=UPI003000F7FE
MRPDVSAARDFGASLINDKWVRVPLWSLSQIPSGRLLCKLIFGTVIDLLRSRATLKAERLGVPAQASDASTVAAAGSISPQ